MSEVKEPRVSTSDLPANVKVLGGASLLNDIASEMAYPLLPRFLLEVLGGNRFLLGVIEGAADTAASMLKLWSGGRADRVERKKGLVLAGYALAAFARPLIGLVTATWQLFGCRILDRIGKGIRTAPRDALISESTPTGLRGRAFGFHRAMDHLGAAIGPLLAAAFLLFWPDRLRILFLLTLLPGVIVLLLLSTYLRDTPPSRERKKSPFTWSLRPFGRSFRIYLFSLVLFSLANSSDAFLLVRAEEVGVPLAWLPILWLVLNLVRSGANLFVGPWVDRSGPKIFLVLGWLCYAVVYLGFAFADQPWQIWLLFVAYALFYGLAEPAEKTLVTMLTPPAQKGLAFGWFHFVMGLTTLPASLLFGALYQWVGPFAAFGTGAGFAVLATGVLVGVRPSTSGSSQMEAN